MHQITAKLCYNTDLNAAQRTQNLIEMIIVIIIIEKRPIEIIRTRQTNEYQGLIEFAVCNVHVTKKFN